MGRGIAFWEALSKAVAVCSHPEGMVHLRPGLSCMSADLRRWHFPEIFPIQSLPGNFLISSFMPTASSGTSRPPCSGVGTIYCKNLSFIFEVPQWESGLTWISLARRNTRSAILKPKSVFFYVWERWRFSLFACRILAFIWYNNF